MDQSRGPDPRLLQKPVLEIQISNFKFWVKIVAAIHDFKAVCLELSNVSGLTSMHSEGRRVYTWSQYLITTNIPGHATKIIRSMLDRMRIDMYNFIKTIRDQCAPSNEFPSPLDTIHDIFPNCDNMMDAYCQLLPDAFSNTNNEAPPPQQFHMPAAPEIPQP
ncbi:unnamed protein product [Lupinus luteus]|uniref:Uncharacterized protein n=1 Tax=Lupinus luteus TaxID=3873 RepID=A0AAV1X5Y9_LUPLU